MEDLSLNEAIRGSAMLVSYHTQAWSGRIKDPKAAIAAAKAMGVTESSVSASTNLMDGADARLRAVTSALESGRQVHARLTLPWTTDDGTRGPRMLPTVKWMDYMKAIAGAKTEYERILADFLACYEDDVAKAQPRVNMKGDPLHLYPSRADIAKHFDLKIDFTPIPSGAQFRGLPEGVAPELEKALERRIQGRMDGAMAEAYLRTHSAVKNLAERLSAENPTFKSAAVENVRELGSMLRAWNLGGDEKLETLANDVEKLVAGEDMKSLKGNEEVRRFVAKEAKRIVAMIEEWEVLP